MLQLYTIKFTLIEGRSELLLVMFEKMDSLRYYCFIVYYVFKMAVPVQELKNPQKTRKNVIPICYYLGS